MLVLIALVLLVALPFAGSMGHAAPCPDCLLPAGLMLCMAVLVAALAIPVFPTQSLARSGRRTFRGLAPPSLDKPPRVV